MTIGEGTSEIQRLVIARNILEEWDKPHPELKRVWSESKQRVVRHSLFAETSVR
jgi:hypothetical protein